MSTKQQETQLQLEAKQLTCGGEDPLLPHLLHAINHADEIEVTVSFIQPSGLALLFDSFSEALANGAQLKLLTSDYLDISHPSALRELMALVDQGADIRIYQTQSNQSFHMKSYIFVKNSKQGELVSGCAFVGSSNISKSALTSGFEWNFRHDYGAPKTSSAAKEFNNIRIAFDEVFKHPNVVTLTHEWITQYIKRRKQQKFIAVAPELTDEQTETPSPRPEQIQALEALNKTREAGFKRGLVVLATGMGKTWLSAFDIKQFRAKRVLFVAHREEILLQAQRTFATLLNHSTGFFNGNQKEYDAECLFASIQTIGRPEHIQQFSIDAFDYIIVDEFHHVSAPGYRLLLDYFEPEFLLGLTATPERTDQADILGLCDHNLVFERNLTQGIDSNTLVPFHYYGIWDENVNYKEIPWRNGRFDPHALEYTFATNKRATHALTQWRKHKQSRTLAFCVSTKHADYMAKAFEKAGVKALAVHSQSKVRRNEALRMLDNQSVEVLFTVDLFNEGTDLPSIDTILMLRPSESKILFLQQLGRGLRRHEGKEHLVVLDFIGNHHSFLNKPFALLQENSATGVVRTLRKPNLPDGCYLNIDLAVTDFWQKLAKAQRTTALEDLTELAEQLGHLPTPSEFYRHYGDLTKVNKQHNGWFDLVAHTSGLDDDKQKAAKQLRPFYDFLNKGVQTTSMTKCFKAILLQAFVQLDGFIKPPTITDLAVLSAKILSRYPNLKQHDLGQKERSLQPDSKAWIAYWSRNPIRHFSSKNKDGSQWFLLEGDNFKANFDVPTEQVESLNSAVLELVDYALAKYSQRPLVQAQMHITTQEEQTKGTVTPLYSEENEETQKLPYFPNLKVACGHFKTGDSSDMTYVPAPFGCGKVDPEKHFLAHASGNSMNGGKHPILDGDLLLLERITANNAGSITNTTIAIEQFDTAGDEQFLLRDVKKQVNEQGKVTYLLVARNPDYVVMEASDEFVTFARLKNIVGQP